MLASVSEGHHEASAMSVEKTVESPVDPERPTTAPERNITQ